MTINTVSGNCGPKHCLILFARFTSRDETFRPPYTKFSRGTYKCTSDSSELVSRDETCTCTLYEQLDNLLACPKVAHLHSEQSWFERIRMYRNWLEYLHPQTLELPLYHNSLYGNSKRYVDVVCIQIMAKGDIIWYKSNPSPFKPSSAYNLKIIKEYTPQAFSFWQSFQDTKHL